MLPLIAMLMPNWMDPEFLLNWLGDWALWGTAAVIFIECGLLFPILPGDSLLFAVGLFIALGTIGVPLWLACVVLTAAAFLGNVSGYYIGRALGTTLFKNPDAKFLKPKYLDQTHAFFDKYGPRALVLARFVPIVRTFITVTAGAGKMDPRKFFFWTGIGAVLWGTGVTLLGHALGRIDFIHEHLESALILLVFISIIPMIVEFVLAKRRERRNDHNGDGRDDRYDTAAERAAVMEKINE
ncbi:DedA family protein [Kribbella amoyensis]|uniref:DedA family protein n=1 Tax=Kribbella amoyensis TaxID=996641 RepID=UPI002353C9FE|nr:DedA family protein [Kribbella amoyensis]